MSAELGYLSACEAIFRFERRLLSPVELTAALIDRSQRYRERINPYTYTYYERALEQARAAEQRYLKRTARPLEGVPIAIKDLHAVAGEHTTQGSRWFGQESDLHSHPGVARLLDAGAILLARTTTPELGIDQVCSTKRWGTTRNPWNVTFTPGASSSGAGAALAAGLVTLADGSDYGGSIRVPACFSGVFGYQAPFGRNPGPSPVNRDTYLHHGPMTRTVRDGGLMQNVLSGPHPNDVSTLRERITIPARLRGVKGWRIAYSMDLGYFDVDDEVIARTEDALAVFREIGCRVEAVEVDWSLASLAAFEIHAAAAFAAEEGASLWNQRGRLPGVIQERLQRGRSLTASDMAYARRIEAQMYERLGSILTRYDALVCPTTGVTAIAADHDALDWPWYEVDGHRMPGMNQVTLAYPFNMLGQLPVANVPSGFARNRVPTGIQIVGRAYDDVGVFRLARAYERAKPWMHQASARPDPAAFLAGPHSM